MKCQHVISPAKLNLGLRIVGRRADGYHLLESLFWPIDLTDEILIEPSETRAITTEWIGHPELTPKFLPKNESNLISQVLDLSHGKGNYRIRVLKKIPIGAGLGGGSSNAAQMLRFLVDKGEISFEKARALSPKIGADVPFFLQNSPAWVTGIGENVRPFPKLEGDITPRLFFLLVLPQIHSSTPQAFIDFKSSGKEFSSSVEFPTKFDSDLDFYNWLGQQKNDLESIVAKRYPLIADILKQLRNEHPILANMSGSGATCFAIFSSQSQREKSAKALESFFRSNKCKGVYADTYIRL